MLDVPVLAVLTTSAQLVAFEDVVAGLEVEIPEAAGFRSGAEVREERLSVGCGFGFSETLAAGMFAAHVAAVVRSALATGHEALVCFYHAFADGAFVDERVAQGRGRLVDGVDQGYRGSGNGLETIKERLADQV